MARTAASRKLVAERDYAVQQVRFYQALLRKIMDQSPLAVDDWIAMITEAKAETASHNHILADVPKPYNAARHADYHAGA